MHTLDPSTQDAEMGGLLSLRSAGAPCSPPKKLFEVLWWCLSFVVPFYGYVKAEITLSFSQVSS